MQAIATCSSVSGRRRASSRSVSSAGSSGYGCSSGAAMAGTVLLMISRAFRSRVRRAPSTGSMMGSSSEEYPDGDVLSASLLPSPSECLNVLARGKDKVGQQQELSRCTGVVLVRIYITLIYLSRV